MNDEGMKYKDQYEQLLSACRLLGDKSQEERLSQLLVLFGKYFELVQGVAFLRDGDVYKQVANYAFVAEDELSFKEGEGIIGQAVKDKKTVFLKKVDISYFTVVSGLGKTNHLNLLIVPLMQKEEVVAVLEMAFFKQFPNDLIEKFKELETCYFKHK